MPNIQVAIDGMWTLYDNGATPLGTVRRFTAADSDDKPEDAQVGWAFALKYVTSYGPKGAIKTTFFVGARIADKPTRLYLFEGEWYEEPMPNYGIEEKYLEAVVRQMAVSDEHKQTFLHGGGGPRIHRGPSGTEGGP